MQLCLHTWLLIAVVACCIVSASAQLHDKAADCGGLQQKCCLACPPEISAAECEQRECSSGRTCHTFGLKKSLPAGDRKPQTDMNVCLDTPECGKEGQPCCYVSDPSIEAERCAQGLACIVSRVGYADQTMYASLLKTPGGLTSTQVMGVCRKLKQADCGKRFYPCGAAARRLGCDEERVVCGAGDFCAAPSDTRLGASRCLPLPERCGTLNNACCPGNKDGKVNEVWLNDNVSAVPYCNDKGSMCVWQHADYARHGLKSLNDAGGKRLLWDGYFDRGYGQSRCVPLPASCGNPGEPCCPSMMDQRISGMVHNRQFKYQPCNYAAAGDVGIYCKGSWQAALLKGEPLGTCTLNTKDCGKLGKQCCREDIAESGSVDICESSQRPGTHYCTADNVCSKCPAVAVTPEQKAECRGLGQATEAGSNAFSARGARGRAGLRRRV